MFVWLGILKRRILNPPALGTPKLKWPTKFCIYGQQTSALGKVLSSFFANEACLTNFDIILSQKAK